MIQRYKVWKLQRPIVTNEYFPTIMAYTEGRRDVAMLPMPVEVMDEVFGDELKIYVLARVVNGVLKIKRQVPEEDW